MSSVSVKTAQDAGTIMRKKRRGENRMSVDFYQTLMGKRFFEGQLPSLIKAINRLAEAVEESNRLSSVSNGEEVIASEALADRCE